MLRELAFAERVREISSPWRFPRRSPLCRGKHLPTLRQGRPLYAAITVALSDQTAATDVAPHCLNAGRKTLLRLLTTAAVQCGQVFHGASASIFLTAVRSGWYELSSRYRQLAPRVETGRRQSDIRFGQERSQTGSTGFGAHLLETTDVREPNSRNGQQRSSRSEFITTSTLEPAMMAAAPMGANIPHAARQSAITL